ncbi:hypothetical protein SK128_024522 [Halocaridina rubra]|uniref:Acylglycerol kinase, mitochondrial n=1 Tax=Halocaridina rubra TaxID=373956 RepID=A0AAN8ZXA0_HALRR
MSRIIRFFRVLRNHPKKSIFFSAVLAYGINWGKNKFEEDSMMRAYCQEALAYGEYSQPLGEQNRHVTVLLNPSAKDGKGKAMYERYCAPLLHLAGLKVATVRTEHEGQARELMEVMENTSAVIIAGGDGTLSEVVTGLLRRADCKDAVCRFPLGVLPLGHTNTATSVIFGFQGYPEARHLAEATMSVIKEIKRPLDLMELTPLQESDDDPPPKPVYAASQLEWSAYRDARERKDAYWYWASLKKYMTYVFSSYKDISWDCVAEIEYSEPCRGCNKCRKEEVKEEEKVEAPRRWWMAYLPKAKPAVTEVEKEDFSNIVNDECGLMQKKTIDSVCDVVISTKNTLHTKDIPGYALSLKTGPSNVGAFQFIREGWSREWNKISSYATETLVGELILRPVGSTKNKKGEDRELNIDSESYEVRPMKIKVLPNAVTIFAAASSVPAA